MEVEEEESWREQPLGPLLEHLWAFRCDLTMGRNVSSMTWNKRNPVRSVFQHTFERFICYIIIIDIFAKLMLGQYHLQFTKKNQFEIVHWVCLQDLLAVGYGQFDYAHEKSGLVCCWSLKNPTVLFISNLLMQI